MLFAVGSHGGIEDESKRHERQVAVAEYISRDEFLCCRKISCFFADDWMTHVQISVGHDSVMNPGVPPQFMEHYMARVEKR